jgi:hypothetical protein
MKLLAAIPLLVLPVALYGLLALTLGGGLNSAEAGARLAQPLFRFTTRGGGTWPVSGADLLLAAALIVVFLELLRGVADRDVAIANHALSITLFVGCLAAMLLAPACANSTFFLLTLMVLLDLVTGFIVTMGQATGGQATGGQATGGHATGGQAAGKKR